MSRRKFTFAISSPYEFLFFGGGLILLTRTVHVIWTVVSHKLLTPLGGCNALKLSVLLTDAGDFAEC